MQILSRRRRQNFTALSKVAQHVKAQLESTYTFNATHNLNQAWVMQMFNHRYYQHKNRRAVPAEPTEPRLLPPIKQPRDSAY
jgi:hypothetical protein